MTPPTIQLSKQHLTRTKKLTDQFLRPLTKLRISVTDHCNFRCPYCMPENEENKGFHDSFINKREHLSFDEISRLTSLLVQLGVSRIRLTGGEPLLRPNISELIQELSQIPGIKDFALTTNGSRLKQHARKIRHAGLHRLTLSLDSLDPAVFQQMNGLRGPVQTVLDGIKIAEKEGFAPIKINVVVQRGINDHTLLDLVEHFRGTPHIVRFIEYMDVGTCNQWKSDKVVPSEEIVKMIHQKYPLHPVEANYIGEVAARYVFADGKGEIGFISSVSQPFCGECTRLRLSPGGKLYTCLFASEGIDLKTPLRAGSKDSELLEIISNTWTQRADKYSENRSLFQSIHPQLNKVEMYRVGG